MEKISDISTSKWGIGTSALIISIFSMMFSFTSLGEKSIGENILQFIGIKFPVGVISLILFVISVFIGHKHMNDYGAKVGRNISLFFIILMAILTIIHLISA